MKLTGTILLVFSFYVSTGQPFTDFSHSILEELPSSEVYDVFQDSRGFLWFGTDNGVCRFDGRVLECFNVKDGLSDPVVFGISEDKVGRIWFRTYSGKISYYHDGKIHPYKFNAVLATICENKIMLSMEYDSLEQLWFTAGNSVVKIDKEGRLDSTNFKQRVLFVRDVGKKHIVGFWGPSQRIDKVDLNGKRFDLASHDSTSIYHVVCAATWNNTLYFTINGNVFAYDAHGIKLVHVGRSPIIFLSTDAENTLWIGYLNNGVERYRNDFSAPELKLLENRSITKALVDHEGGVWLTSLEKGAHYIPNPSIMTMTLPPDTKLTAVISSGALIVTGDNAGHLVAYDAKTRQIVMEKKFRYPIVTIYATSTGNIWVSTIGSVMVFDRNFRLLNSIKASRIGFAEMENGHLITVNASHISIFTRHGDVLRYFDGPTIYRSILVSDSIVFLASRSGLHVFTQDLTFVTDIPALQNAKIIQMENLNDSTVLIGTLGSGFFILNKPTLSATQFNSQKHFNADNVYSIMVDRNAVWLATEKGIAIAPLGSFSQDRLNFNFLTRSTGLIASKTNFLVPSGSGVWAFSDNGISIVPHRSERYANKHPLFLAGNVVVNNKVITGSNLTLSHTENNVRVEYTCISFNNPDILTRYRLSPQYPWAYSNVRSILFSSLAPGDYAFELEYSADNITWKKALPTFSFIIKTPWWNRWYTYLSTVFVLAGLGYWYFRYQQGIYREKNEYLRIINEHQQRLLQSEIVTLERERNRISKELHDRVGTNLTAIKLLVGRLLKKHREDQATDVEEQFQIAIAEIRDIIYGLTPPSLERYGLFTGLKNYVGKLTKSVPISISLKTYGKESNDYNLNTIIFRVLQELLTNSIKHSFANNITIHINSFDDMISVVYEDDGIGFSHDPVQSGLGLDNVESRIHSINGTLKFESGKFGISYTIDIPQNLKKEAV